MCFLRLNKLRHAAQVERYQPFASGSQKCVGMPITAGCLHLVCGTCEQCLMHHAAQVKRYQPFASGSRNCVGMPQATVTMQAVLAVLLSRFSFRLAEKVRAHLHLNL